MKAASRATLARAARASSLLVILMPYSFSRRTTSSSASIESRFRPPPISGSSSGMSAAGVSSSLSVSTMSCLSWRKSGSGMGDLRIRGRGNRFKGGLTVVQLRAEAQPPLLQPANAEEGAKPPPQRPGQVGMARHDGTEGGADVPWRLGTHENGKALVVIKHGDKLLKNRGMALDGMGVMVAFRPGQAAAGPVGLRQQIHRGLGRPHRHVDAGGKDRIEKSRGVAHQQ